MSYQRVIPRDLFNEAKLLKCLGHLIIMSQSIKCPEGLKITIKENGKPFDIQKDDSSGDIYVSNYKTKVNGKLVRFETSLNSQRIYPLSCFYDNALYAVFEDDGEFDQEFIDAFMPV